MGGGEECPAFDFAFVKWSYYCLPPSSITGSGTQVRQQMRNCSEPFRTDTGPGNGVVPSGNPEASDSLASGWSQGNQDNYSFHTTDTATLSQTPALPAPGWGRYCLRLFE